MEKRYLPEILQSPNVILKKHSLNLAQQMFSYVEKDRQRLREFLSWVDKTQTQDDLILYIKAGQERWKAFELFDYGLYDPQSHAYMGNIGVHTISWEHERCEIGYWIAAEFEGKGFISYAVKILEDCLFKLGFYRIEIRCSPSNKRSIHVPLRNGYCLEGHLRGQLCENGRFRDTLVFGKLKSDWADHRHHRDHPDLLDHNEKTGINGKKIFLQDIDSVLLLVNNVQESKNWYSLVLQINPTLELENFVQFRPGGQALLCLHPADEKSPLSPGGSVGYWRTSNFSQTLQRFLTYGAKVYRGPLKREDNQMICQLMDPFGNILGLAGD